MSTLFCWGIFNTPVLYCVVAGAIAASLIDPPSEPYNDNKAPRQVQWNIYINLVHRYSCFGSQYKGSIYVQKLYPPPDWRIIRESGYPHLATETLLRHSKTTINSKARCVVEKAIGMVKIR